MPGVQRPTVDSVSSLIGAIYDAALEPAAWLDILPRVAQFVGGHGASLAARASDKEKSSDIFFATGLPSQAYIDKYLERYNALDPCHTAFLLAHPGQIVSTCDAIDYDDFRQTRMCREWAEPQELVDGAVAILDKTASTVAMVTVFRHARDGLVDEEARARLALLAPHLQRAARITRSIECKAQTIAIFAEILDGLRTAVFLVDREVRICHVNESGRAMLSDGDVVCDVQGRLSARQRGATQSLANLCAAATENSRSHPAPSRSVPFTSRSGEHLVAHVLPLSAQAKQHQGFDHVAVAAIFVQRGDAPLTRQPLQALADTYALTASELRILLSIAERGGASEAADKLGLGEATVRTHLHRLFAKTGLSRQSDLVRLATRFMSPLLK